MGGQDKGGHGAPILLAKYLKSGKMGGGGWQQVRGQMKTNHGVTQEGEGGTELRRGGKGARLAGERGARRRRSSPPNLLESPMSPLFPSNSVRGERPGRERGGRWGAVRKSVRQRWQGGRRWPDRKSPLGSSRRLCDAHNLPACPRAQKQ